MSIASAVNDKDADFSSRPVKPINPVIRRDIAAAVLAQRDALAKKGVDIGKLKLLGTGVAGQALEIQGTGRVLKVTTDTTEARAAHGLIGKQLKHVYRIFDVWRFKPPQHEALRVPGAPGGKLFGVLQELLEKIPRSPALENALRSMRLVAAPGAAAGRPEDWRALLAAAKQRGAKGGVDHHRVLRSLETTDIPKAVDELASVGVAFYDWHQGNLMRRPSDGAVVVIDLGFSSAPGGDPPVLERDQRFISTLDERMEIKDMTTLLEFFAIDEAEGDDLDDDDLDALTRPNRSFANPFDERPKATPKADAGVGSLTRTIKQKGGMMTPPDPPRISSISGEPIVHKDKYKPAVKPSYPGSFIGQTVKTNAEVGTAKQRWQNKKTGEWGGRTIPSQKYIEMTWNGEDWVTAAEWAATGGKPRSK